MSLPIGSPQDVIATMHAHTTALLGTWIRAALLYHLILRTQADLLWLPISCIHSLLYRRHWSISMQSGGVHVTLDHNNSMQGKVVLTCTYLTVLTYYYLSLYRNHSTQLKII